MLLARNRILTTFLTHYTGICLYRGSGKWLTAGDGPSASQMKLPGMISGMTVVHRHGKPLPHVLPRWRSSSAEVWLWVHSSFTWGTQAGGRRCAETYLKWEHRVCMPQSWLIFRHCWNRWLFCIHYCRFFLLHDSQISSSFSAIEKWFCS